jgi:ATP/maltotriose-dependent transcriptional regulator MalT
LCYSSFEERISYFDLPTTSNFLSNLQQNHPVYGGYPMEQQSTNILAISSLHELPGETYHTLTRREREVLTLIAAGQSNRQMAENLVVSPETVKTHVRHVLGKLGVARKAEIQAILRDRRYH